jgi:hypothetical protein
VQLINPIFLLGTQRSGTTLLTRILSAHSGLYIQNELPMQGLFDTPIDKEILLQRFTRSIARIHKKQLSIEESKELRWGLKDPLLTYQLEHLATYFPDSKYILIVRDGRGVVNSYMDNRWGLGTNVFSGAKRWKEEIQLQTEFAKRFKDNCLSIRYEDLISDLESTLVSICTHLDITYDSAMLTYHKAPMEFDDNRENRNTQKAPDKKLGQKWRDILTSRQVGIIEYVAGKELEQYGYQHEGEKVKPSYLELAYYRLHQAIKGELQLQYQLKLRQKLKKLGWVK